MRISQRGPMESSHRRGQSSRTNFAPSVFAAAAARGGATQQCADDAGTRALATTGRTSALPASRASGSRVRARTRHLLHEPACVHPLRRCARNTEGCTIGCKACDGNGTRIPNIDHCPDERPDGFEPLHMPGALHPKYRSVNLNATPGSPEDIWCGTSSPKSFVSVPCLDDGTCAQLQEIQSVESSRQGSRV